MRIAIPVLTRLLSALCALTVAAAGALIVVEVIANWTGNGFVILPADWPSQLRSTAWEAPIARNALLIALLVALVLLLVAFWRRPPLTVDTHENGLRVERHALEASLRRRLDVIDGVDESRVRIDANRIRASVETSRRIDPESVRLRAVEELTSFCTLHDLRLTPDVALRAKRGQA
jgi:D-alanyl-D-alanine dipeptidase